MIEKAAERILNFTVKNLNSVNPSDTDRQIYKYGIEILISSLISIALIMGAGVVFHSVAESVIFLTVFIALRQFTGGYHAKTYLACDVTFFFSYLAVLALSELTAQAISPTLAVCVLLFEAVGVIFLAPIKNPHKPINEEIKKKAKAISITLWIAIGAVSVYLIFRNSSYGATLFYTLMLIWILMIIGKMKGEICDVKS